jgi:hypothetical protein
MFSFDAVGLMTPTQITLEQSDPRGGRVIDCSSSLRYNNMHVPYRGGDWAMVPLDQTGTPTGYLWCLPYVEDSLADVSTLRVITALKAKTSQPVSGSAAQVWADGMSFGVAQ